MQTKDKMIRILTVTALGAALGATVVGCSNQNSSTTSSLNKDSKSTKKTKNAVQQNETKLKRTDIKISQTEALNKFDQKFNNKKIKSIDLKAEGNSYVYEIEGVDNNKEYDATIDANSGKILRSHSEKLDWDEKVQKTLDFDNLISRNEATKIAEGRVKGTAQEWKLEQEKGKAYWEVTINSGSKKTEVKIDAASKKVVELDHED